LNSIFAPEFAWEQATIPEYSTKLVHFEASRIMAIELKCGQNVVTPQRITTPQHLKLTDLIDSWVFLLEGRFHDQEDLGGSRASAGAAREP
jgi:hypothetical protein